MEKAFSEKRTKKLDSITNIVEKTQNTVWGFIPESLHFLLQNHFFKDEEKKAIFALKKKSDSSKHIKMNQKTIIMKQKLQILKSKKKVDASSWDCSLIS